MIAGPSHPDPAPDVRAVVGLLVVVGLVSAVAAAVLRDGPIVGTSLVLVGASVLRLRRTPPPTIRSVAVRRLAAGLVNAALTLVTVGTSVAAAEGVMRWVYRDVTTTADFRGYFTTRWMRTQVRHNHYDYRGAEFDEIKAPGTYRVAVMGDSFTYGNGVAEDQRFSNLLAAALHDRDIEVLNFGFPGNNWPEHVKTLERRVLRLRPDFVLLQWGTNDVELGRDVAGRPRIPPLVRNRAWHEWLYSQSALYTMLNAQWIRLQLTRAMGDTYPGYMRRLYADPASDGAVQAAALMRRFIELCVSRGVGVGLVLFPDAAVSFGDDYPYRFLHDRVLAICAEKGIQCLDLLPVLARVPDRRTLWVTPLDSHPSPLANRIAADEIRRAFGPAWGARVPPPPRRP